MEPVWPSILAFLGVFTLAIVSPGPNFILVTNTALNDSRSAGLMTSLGVATGSGLFALAGLAGLLPLVHALPHFGELMRFAGGGYLLWLGFDMLRTCRLPLAAKQGAQADDGAGGAGRQFRTGLLTNLTNPKAWAFYLSLFTLVMQPGLPLWAKGFLNLCMFSISLAWYAAMALVISSRRLQPVFLGWRPLLQGLLGCFLLLLGGRILLG
jgi:threonine/homoserine/homoserine lactone efflux protein